MVAMHLWSLSSQGMDLWIISALETLSKMSSIFLVHNLKNGSRILEFFEFVFPYHVMPFPFFFSFLFQRLTTLKGGKIELESLNYLSNNFIPVFCFWKLVISPFCSWQKHPSKEQEVKEQFPPLPHLPRCKRPNASDRINCTVCQHNTGPVVKIMRLTR